MTSPLERAARALCCPRGCQNAGKPYDPIGGSVSICQAHTYRADVLAVLQALRKPSEGMAQAGWMASRHVKPFCKIEVTYAVWEAMIDTLIEEAGR
jgi:hypothetical protein